MLVRDQMVNVHRATEADAHGIAALHATAERRQIELVRGKAEVARARIDEDEQIWRRTLHLASGDHRPWIAWRGDRPDRLRDGRARAVTCPRPHRSASCTCSTWKPPKPRRQWHRRCSSMPATTWPITASAK